MTLWTAVATGGRVGASAVSRSQFKIQVNVKKLSSSDRPLLQASNIWG
ncbi:MAG: hypothetical protein ACR2F4_01455 [Thermoleophilaceae bacterium]